MEIGGIDLITSFSHREIANLFAESWVSMLIQDVNERDVHVYHPEYPLPNEFFLYRDIGAYMMAEYDGSEGTLEGMVYIVGGTVVYDHNTPSDVAAIVAKIPKEEP